VSLFLFAALPSKFESRENETVSRGSKAVNMIYQLTTRVQALIEQSHLERNEGVLCFNHGLVDKG
jgi:hypothetical protein